MRWQDDAAARARKEKERFEAKQKTRRTEPNLDVKDKWRNKKLSDFA